MKLISKFIGKTLASSKSFRTFAVNKSDTGIYTLSQYILIASLCGLLTLMSDLFTHIARHFFLQNNQSNEQIRQPHKQCKGDSEKGA